jgi:3-hydroxyisobutyrate dehydrogenase
MVDAPGRPVRMPIRSACAVSSRTVIAAQVLCHSAAVGTPQRVGFIGLGSMGSRIVTLLAGAGFEVTLWARRPEAVEPFRTLPSVRAAETVGEVGERSEVVGVCVWAEPDVEEVVLAVARRSAPGTVIVIHSTVSPAFCVELARQVAPRGVSIVDAPVSTRVDVDKLVVMAGGDEAALSRCRAVLEAIGDPLLHFGTLGGGQQAKLVNNVLLAANVGLARQALTIGARLGLDHDPLATALLHGSSSTVPGMRMLLRAMAISSTGPQDRFAQEWALKDVALMMSELERCGVDDEESFLRLGWAGAHIVAGDH